MSFELIVASTSLAAAALAAIQGVSRSVAAAISWRNQRNKLSSLRVREVIARANLNALGSLIIVDLGATSMPNYVRHAEVRDGFRHAFNAARGFIGESFEPAPEEAEAPAGAGARELFSNLRAEPTTNAGNIALKDVAEGETWNALARMRRELELTLAARLNIGEESRRPMAAGQMLAVAVKQGIVPADLMPSVRYAISIANRGVHGQEVPADAAVEAIYLMDRFIRFLKSNPDTSQSSSAP